jgi:DNA-binding Lrp family transcriptional regulator
MSRSGLDDLDLQIIHGLQVEPRVTWNVLAGILDSDAVTLARRWGRIESEGLAWISAIGRGPGNGSAALVEFSCHPGDILGVAELAAAEPSIYSIDLTAGRMDLLATLIVEDDAALAEFALERLGAIPGVRSVRTHVLSGEVSYGSSWTVQALRREQVAAIPGPRAPRPGSAKVIAPALATRLRGLLEHNARASYSELADVLGISSQRVGDAMARLRRSGDLQLRTDVSGPASNWPVVAWFFIQASAATAGKAEQMLADLPAVQFAAIATGPFNLIVAAAARSKPQLLQIEAALERRLPQSRIVDRAMVLRVHKHLGRSISVAGRANGPAVLPR